MSASGEKNNHNGGIGYFSVSHFSQKKMRGKNNLKFTSKYLPKLNK